MNQRFFAKVQKKIKALQDLSFEPYRFLTNHYRALPSFIIIGAQKCGTTSLYHYLVQHPQINPAWRKELHFFNKKYNRGWIWYRSRFPFHKEGFITGEASPNYLFCPDTPQRIADHLPSTKLILLLRDPVDRAYSHYFHNLRANRFSKQIREPLSFEEAIAKEEERLSVARAKIASHKGYYGDDYMHYSYLSRGIYIDQIRHWFSFFPREQFLILQSENFLADPATALQKVLNFLDLPAWEYGELEQYNALNYRAMPEETRDYLIEYFKNHNEALYEYLDMRFDWKG
jgi:Sulfotransferase domain